MRNNVFGAKIQKPIWILAPKINLLITEFDMNFRGKNNQNPNTIRLELFLARTFFLFEKNSPMFIFASTAKVSFISRFFTVKFFEKTAAIDFLS